MNPVATGATGAAAAATSQVAGDDEGISTFQLDIKCEGLSVALLERALEQARRGRLHILAEMRAAMPQGHRAALPPSVPRLATATIPGAAIGRVIGPGGKSIRALTEEFGVEVNIEEEGGAGLVTVSGFDDAKMAACVAKIEAIAGEAAGAGRPAYEGPMPPEGLVLRKVPVVSVKTFGVFVSLEGHGFPGLEGLVHVSELHTERIRNIAGFVKEGQVLDVKVIGLSPDGKLKLSRKATLGSGGPDAGAQVDE